MRMVARPAASPSKDIVMEAASASLVGGARMAGQLHRHTDATLLRAPQITAKPQRCLRLVTRMSRQASPVQVPVKGFDGGDAGSATLSLKVAEPTKAKGLVHRHVVTILQNQRQGSANTKTRAEVTGGGRKPFAQKGTGNARQGSRTTPLKPGGGVVFGPKPKDWSIRMNKKERRLALSTALQSAAGDITVVDDLKVGGIKTKALVDALGSLGADPSKQQVLLIVDKLSKEIELSARNIANLSLNESGALNTYDVLRADRIVMDKAALTYINDFYGRKDTA